MTKRQPLLSPTKLPRKQINSRIFKAVDRVVLVALGPAVLVRIAIATNIVGLNIVGLNIVGRATIVAQAVRVRISQAMDLSMADHNRRIGGLQSWNASSRARCVNFVN
jgi:hypothetical protein